MKAALLVLALVACGASAREKALQAALVATDSARAGFVAFDGSHQMALVDAAPNRDVAEKQLADWRGKQAVVEKLFVGMYQAIATAAVVQNDSTMAGVVQAALLLNEELHADGVLK